MKKVLVSMIAGAMALGGALPVSAGDENGMSDMSIWEIIDEDDDWTVMADLILIAGMATMLDTCGNGKPFYTVFAPEDEWDDEETEDTYYLLEVLDTTIADLQATPAVVKALLNDHIVNGSFSPWQLEMDEITVLTARSGFTIRNENREYLNDLYSDDSEQACNGFVYTLEGVFDSTPQVPTEGLNAQDSPTDGTPGGSNSLPDTL